MDFGRLIVAMVTPFRENLEIDLGRAAELARRLVADGVDAFVLSGTTESRPRSRARKRSTSSKQSRKRSMCP